ncbi:MAG TPA: SNF2-related protein [bacterium]|nr:SNF2-related protein [bacterium]
MPEFRGSKPPTPEINKTEGSTDKILTKNALAKELGVDAITVERWAEEYRSAHPEWFQHYTKQDREYEYYHPDLIAELRSRVEKRPEVAPDGWMTRGAIAALLRIAHETIDRRMSSIREEHPEWFVNFLTPKKQVHEHFHPDLVALLLKEHEQRARTAPEGWKTPVEIGLLFGESSVVVSRAASFYREEHPEWFGNYIRETKKGLKSAEFLHPDLIALIKRDMESREPHAPGGWMTNKAISSELKRSQGFIERLSDPYRASHPEWFKQFRTPQGITFEHYHPDLLVQIRSLLAGREVRPEGWEGKGSLALRLGLSSETVGVIADGYRAMHPEWFKNFEYRGKVQEHYDPALIEIIEKNTIKEVAPEGWMTKTATAWELKVSPNTIERMAQEYRSTRPDWFVSYSGAAKRVIEHYHPDLIENIRKELAERSPEAPEDWMTKSAISKVMNRSTQTIEKISDNYRTEHPEWFADYTDTVGKIVEHYHPDLIRVIESELLMGPIEAPSGWLTKTAIANVLKTSAYTVAGIARKYRSAHPDWFVSYADTTKKTAEHYHPDLIEHIRKELAERSPEAPEGWMTINAVCLLFDVSPELIGRLVNKHRESQPTWYQFYRSTGGDKEYLHPDLIEIIRKELSERLPEAPEGWLTKSGIAKKLRLPYHIARREIESIADRYPDLSGNYLDSSKRAATHFDPQFVELLREHLLEKSQEVRDSKEDEKTKIIQYVSEVNRGQTLEGKAFQTLLALCGSSRAADILYRFKPEYKKFPPEYVRSILGDYLGECMVAKRPFRFEDVVEYHEYFSDPSFGEGLMEVIKADCLAFYYRERKTSRKSDYQVIYAYLDRAVEALGDLKNKYIDDAIEEVTAYFTRAFSLEKPDRMVDYLVQNRDFPDINQRINTREIHEKQRVLIADEMGLGKSASVIFAKETLGIGTALLVVPSNVIELGTWQGYLSDDQERKGYFKEGLAPRVLVINSPQDFDLAEGGDYDYVIISHERLNERNMPGLASLQFDMLVVDEAHKMKAISGKRSDRLLELARQVEGENKYLALLTATPAPNRVQDLAVSLKLLYPSEYAEITPRALAKQIIHGDVLDLRERLLQRMQMKSLEDSVEMPPLRERLEIVQLSPLEKDVYNAIVEDDELESTEKFSILRKFLLNARQFDPTPGLESAKVRELRESLVEKLATHSKIVVFVNDYIEGIIRGKDSIIGDLQLPPDVKTLVVHGENRSERAAIQEEFRNTEQKVVLLVSGQTSDVGVDFSAGEDVEFLNEPLTEYQRQQQRSRVYRPGIRRPLETKTYIAAGTIDEGVHQHIQTKFHAVEKILRGIPLSELEQRILESDSDEEMAEVEVNPELGKFYFSTLQRLQKMFVLGKDIGEERFKEFVDRFGKEYAEGYKTAGARSYQANVNRFAGGLIETFIEDREQQPHEIKILDIPSGPEMLRRHGSAKLANSIVSVDLNKEHFADAEGEHAVGSFTSLPYEDGTFDYLNCALGLHYTSYRPTKDDYERVRAFQEMNRVLKIGGRVVINEMFSLQFRDAEKFTRIAELLGFSVVNEYTGSVEAGSNYRSNVVTLEKKENALHDLKDIKRIMEAEGLRAGLKWKIDTKIKLKDSRKIITSYEINGKSVECTPNAEDQSVIIEERRITTDGEALRDLHGNIPSIPREEVIDNKFIRIRPKTRYVLFKSLSSGNGAVVVRDSE